MNVERIINMAVRMVMRQVMRKGVNAGMDAVGRRMAGGKTQDNQASSPEGKQTAKRAKQVMRISRKIGRL